MKSIRKMFFAAVSAMAATAIAAPAHAENFYAGLRFHSASLEYDNAQFVNPRRTVSGRLLAPGDGRISGNGDQSDGSWSAMLGRQLQTKPVRVELEYGQHGSETFTSYWEPFDPFAQRVTVDSRYLLVNALYDWEFRPLTLFAGGGVGIARNKTKGEQVDETPGAMPVDRRFAENTDTNFAYALIVGASKTLSERFDVELSYRYLDLGDANSGRSLFDGDGPTLPRVAGDEQYKGDLSSTQISLGVRVKF